MLKPTIDAMAPYRQRQSMRLAGPKLTGLKTAQKFESQGSAKRFVSAHGPIGNTFNFQPKTSEKSDHFDRVRFLAWNGCS